MTNQKSPAVLVAAASRHGSTAEIAAFIADRLREELPPTWHVHVEDTDAIRTIEGYDAVVLGSGVYEGHWLSSARKLLKDTARAPVSGLWLFSSGPAADGPHDNGLVPAAVKAANRLAARDNIVFSGDMTLRTLGLVEGLLVSAMRAEGGDFRDWEVIKEWVAGIALELSNTTVALHPVAAFPSSTTGSGS